jgi:hypothetical protein
MPTSKEASQLRVDVPSQHVLREGAPPVERDLSTQIRAPDDRSLRCLDHCTQEEDTSSRRTQA